MTLMIMGVCGFITWSLWCGRSVTWDNHQHGRFACIVGADEAVGIVVGMWLAKSGTYAEGIACALGGMAAAYLISRGRREV